MRPYVDTSKIWPLPVAYFCPLHSIVTSDGCGPFADKNSRLWNTYRPTLRHKLFLDRDNGPTNRRYFLEGEIWIVAHIRRGDVGVHDRGRGTPFEDIVRLLTNITSRCQSTGRRCRLTIHTEKRHSDSAMESVEDDDQMEYLRTRLSAEIRRDAPPLAAWIDMVGVLDRWFFFFP